MTTTTTTGAVVLGEPGRQAYSAAEVAGMLGVGELMVRRQIRKGKIKATKLGSRLLVPRSEIERILAGEPTAAK